MDLELESHVVQPEAPASLHRDIFAGQHPGFTAVLCGGATLAVDAQEGLWGFPRLASIPGTRGCADQG